jgi:hypothetical protein
MPQLLRISCNDRWILFKELRNPPRTFLPLTHKENKGQARFVDQRLFLGYDLAN